MGKRILKKTFSILLAFSVLLQLVPVFFGVSAASVPTDASLWNDISTINQRCLDYDRTHYGLCARNGYTGFPSLCAHYVHIQLMLLGINNSYVGGNGNDEYNNYENLAYSQGGRKIHAYPIEEWSLYDALRDINSQSRISTGILVGFHETCTASGKLMGHVLLIHGIIDGTIYYTENFATRLGGRDYTAGVPIKCTIEEFNTFYARPSVFKIEGVIWFEDEALTEAVGKGSDYVPDKTGGETGGITHSYETGMYRTKIGMNIRSSWTTSVASLGVIPANSTVCITEIHQNWGKIFTTVNGKEYDGWMCLDYSTYLGELSPVAAEKYSGTTLVSRQWYDSLEQALSDNIAGKTILLYADCDMDKSVTIGEGVTLRLGSYKLNMKNGATLLVRGGKLIADTNVPAADVDPFLTVTTENNKKVYTCNVNATIKTGGLVIRNGAAAKITANITVPSTLRNAKYELVCTDFAGEERVFSASSVSSTKLEFVTDSIPVEHLADKMEFYVRITAVSNSVTYVYESDTASFSAQTYAGQIYGTDSKTTPLVASLMNYSTAKQKLDGVAADKYTNLVLPESERTVVADDSLLVAALDAPAVQSNMTEHINSTRLELDGDASLVFSTGSKNTTGLTLLVFSRADYLKLTAGGKSASKVLTSANATYKITADENGNFVFNEFTAKQYADTYYFRLCKSDGSYDSVFTFSVTEYCRRAVMVSADEDVINLCRAICAFSAAARECFGYKIAS